MRTALLVALLTASASAQPLASSFGAAAWSPTPSDVPPGVVVVSGAAFGTAGALIGSGGAALTLAFIAFTSDDGDLFGSGSALPYAVAFTAGGAVGSAVMIGMVSEGLAGRWAGPVDSGLRPGDWRRALVGAAVGSVPGLLTVALIGPSEGGLEWIAVPIAQGIGAGFAIGL